jgi:hypothetical protein
MRGPTAVGGPPLVRAVSSPFRPRQLAQLGERGPAVRGEGCAAAAPGGITGGSPPPDIGGAHPERVVRRRGLVGDADVGAGPLPRPAVGLTGRAVGPGDLHGDRDGGTVVADVANRRLKNFNHGDTRPSKCQEEHDHAAE